MKHERERVMLLSLFNNMLSNELAKALVAVAHFDANENWNHYGGTSYTTLVVSWTADAPAISPDCGIEGIAETLSHAWVDSSRFVARKAQRILPSSELRMMKEYGALYGVEISPKAIAVAMGSYVPITALNKIGVPDLYRFPEYDLREQRRILKKVTGLLNIPVSPQGLALADSCHAENMKESSYVFPPGDFNQVLCEIGERTRQRVARRCGRDRSFVGSGPILLLSGDTDNPYRCGPPLSPGYAAGAPFTPGLTLVGATGSMADMNVLTIFRLAMVAQLLRGNVLHSRATGSYRPFTMFGMGTPRDIASGFLNVSGLSGLRYPGLIDMQAEFMALKSKLVRLAFAERGARSTARHVKRNNERGG